MSGPMGLTLPSPGDTTDTWGVVLNTLLGLVENHDHTTGKGSLVPSAGLGINADVSWASYALTAAKAVTFTEQAPTAMTSYSSALFASSSDHNLYWRNSSGTNVQITAGNQLNLSAVGGIGGDYAAVSALVDFTDATHSYGFHQQVGSAVRQYAKLFAGDVSLYEFKANPAAGVPANAVTLKSPTALAAPYSYTFPAALPAQAAPLTVDATGALKTDGVFGTNQNLKLQGTGYVQRGARSWTAPLRGVMSANISGGGATTPSIGAAGAGCPASSSNTFLIPSGSPEEQLMTITSVTVYAAVSGGAVTFSLQATTSAGNFTTILAATNSSSSLSQYSPITLTPSSPFTWISQVLPGGFLGLNVNCAAAVTCNVLSVVFNTTVT